MRVWRQHTTYHRPICTVSATTTLNAGYGSKYYCDELGFMLNNEMDDFSSKPEYQTCLDL
jgi:gamma-glutamyltranspeptidase